MNFKRYIWLPMTLFLTESKASQVSLREEPHRYVAPSYIKSKKKKRTWLNLNTPYIIPPVLGLVLVTFGKFSTGSESVSEHITPDNPQSSPQNNYFLFLFPNNRSPNDLGDVWQEDWDSETEEPLPHVPNQFLPSGAVTEQEIDETFWVKPSGLYLKQYTNTRRGRKVIPYKSDEQTIKKSQCVLCREETNIPVRSTCCQQKTCYCLLCIKDAIKINFNKCPTCHSPFSVNMEKAFRVAYKLTDDKGEVLNENAENILKAKLEQEVKKEPSNEEERKSIAKVKEVLDSEDKNINNLLIPPL
ncbi:MAG: hypothetical protein AAF335_02890 [Bacteroidota bacterium]